MGWAELCRLDADDGVKGSMMHSLRTATSRYARRGTLVLCALALGTAAVAVSTVAPAGATGPPVLLVTPSSGYFDGQSVQVSGSNLQPTTPYQLEECTNAGCDATTAVSASTDGSGTLASTPYTVHENITISATAVNCGPGGSLCAIAALGGPGSPPFAGLIFGECVGPPCLQVTPVNGLQDGQVTTVSGFGFSPSEAVNLYECTPEAGPRTLADCDLSTQTPATAGVTGAFSVPFTVQRTISTAATGTINCITAPGPQPDTCFVDAVPFYLNDFAQLNFAQPSVTVSPNSGLMDGQVVQVSGSNLQPTTPYQLEECTLAGCDATTAVSASTDGSGTLAPTPYTVHQHITINATAVDCAVSPCAIVALGGPGSPPFAQISLSPPPPSLMVSPNSGLADGQSVAVSGSNLQPTTPYLLEECTLAGCDATTAVSASTDGSGTLASTSYTVHQHITINATAVDCAVSGCAIVALGGPGSPPFATFSFEPPPTIGSFSPGSGPVGTGVTVTGSNFTGATSVTFNGTEATFTVNSAGQITATVPAGATTGPIVVTTPEGTATGSTDFIVFAYSTGGSFVIGDQNAGIGTSVTFWGAQWAKQNSLSGGSAPNSFKGFASKPTTPPSCTTTWSTGPGNSSSPADTIPSYLAVIVTNSVTKAGSTISGNTTEVAIIKTNPGYAADPGHAGTGTVVAVLPCS